MRIAICDDDRDFCMQTVRMVGEAFERRGIAAKIESFADGASLLAARTAGAAFDAYFLDVIMPGMDGLALARKLRVTQPGAPIVFLTTSEDYTFEAFSVDAAHYLLKPLKEDRLDLATDRLLALLPKPERKTLVVRTSEGGIASVSPEQIALAESDGHYQCLRLVDGRRVRCRMSGVELLERLSESGWFVPANKGVVLGIRHVRSLVADGAVLSNGLVVPVSRRAFPEIRKAFFRYNCR